MHITQNFVKELKNFEQIYYLIGLCFEKKRLYPEAVKNYKKAIKINNSFVNALLNLSNLYSRLGEYNLAEHILLKLYRINNQSLEVLNNLGIIYKNLRKFDKSLDYLKKALTIDKENTNSLFNLANLYFSIKDFKKAEFLYESFINNDSYKLKSLLALAQIYIKRNSYDKALSFLLEIKKINPIYPSLNYFIGICEHHFSNNERAVLAYKKELENHPSNFFCYSNLLYTVTYSQKFNLKDYEENVKKYGSFFENCKNSCTLPAKRVNKKNINIGFVSGDLRDHSVGYFMEGLVQNFDRSFANLHAFYNNSKESESTLTKRIKQNFSSWNNIFYLSDKDSEKIIKTRKIDILIDLSGHTNLNKLSLFYKRCAPIQVSWLGYWATTGIKEMDYFVADPYLINELNEPFFSEKIIKLPNTRWCFTAPSKEIDIGESPVILNKFFTFGSFGNFSKVSSSLMSAWAQILKSAENSKLLVVSKSFKDLFQLKKFCDFFLKYNISSDRLILLENVDRYKYFELYNKVDLILDTFPFSGGTTSVESLWMGVPFLSMKGDTLVSRQGYSILKNINLESFIASSQEDYISKAVHFSNNYELLVQLRRTLRKRLVDSPLCDAKRFALDFQKQLEKIL